jgi:uncharacterized protein YejL (UPF0352 family)
MKHFTLIFAACLFVSIVAVPTDKPKAVPVDEVEAMLGKISKNLQAASVATAQAKAMGEAMVESKVAEKAELKEAVVKAQAKAEKYAKTMMFMGVDTSLAEMDTLSLNNMMKLNGL